MSGKPNQTEDSKERAIYLSWLTGKHTLLELAKKYSVCESTVSKVIERKLKNRKLSV